MTRFNYLAIDQQGKKKRGTADAESSFALANQLRQQGLTIISATRLDIQPVSTHPKLTGKKTICTQNQIRRIGHFLSPTGDYGRSRRPARG